MAEYRALPSCTRLAQKRLREGCRACWRIEVTDGDLRPKEYQKKGNPAFFVTCRVNATPPYANYYFTKSDLQSGKAIALPTAITAAQAEAICMRDLKAQLNYPSTLDVDNINVSDAVLTNGRRGVDINFSAKNAFGLELKALGKAVRLLAVEQA